MLLARISSGARPSAQPTHVRIDAAEVFGLLPAGIRSNVFIATACLAHSSMNSSGSLLRFRSPRSSLGNNKRNGPPLQSHSAFELLALLRTVTAAQFFATPDRGGPSYDDVHVTQELLNTRAALGNGERHLGWAVEVACLGPYNDHTTSSRSIRASPLGRSSACSIPGVGTASAVGLP